MLLDLTVLLPRIRRCYRRCKKALDAERAQTFVDRHFPDADTAISLLVDGIDRIALAQAARTHWLVKFGSLTPGDVVEDDFLVPAIEQAGSSSDARLLVAIRSSLPGQTRAAVL